MQNEISSVYTYIVVLFLDILKREMSWRTLYVYSICDMHCGVTYAVTWKEKEAQIAPSGLVERSFRALCRCQPRTFKTLVLGSLGCVSNGETWALIARCRREWRRIMGCCFVFMLLWTPGKSYLWHTHHHETPQRVQHVCNHSVSLVTLGCGLGKILQLPR